jgi:hypothetical protein
MINHESASNISVGAFCVFNLIPNATLNKSVDAHKLIILSNDIDSKVLQLACQSRHI